MKEESLSSVLIVSYGTLAMTKKEMKFNENHQVIGQAEGTLLDSMKSYKRKES